MNPMMAMLVQCTCMSLHTCGRRCTDIGCRKLRFRLVTYLWWSQRQDIRAENSQLTRVCSHLSIYPCRVDSTYNSSDVAVLEQADLNYGFLLKTI